MKPHYPIYVISKGRANRCLTARFLIADKVDFKLAVEPQEAKVYGEAYGQDRLLVLPFSNLGQGSIPARNAVWEHARSIGAERHWILDDNIYRIRRRYKCKRIPVNAGSALAICEQFIDRYSNLAIAGLNYSMFVPDGRKIAPFMRNVHVYSCLCIRNDLHYRWRGRYNEDTDLCLQAVASGECTVSFNAFTIDKVRTMTMKGGNSDELYADDGRLRMARSLERAWPYIVETKRRFKRPQHFIRYTWGRFDTPLKLKPGVQLPKPGSVDNHGLQLVQAKPKIKAQFLKDMLRDQKSGSKNASKPPPRRRKAKSAKTTAETTPAA